MTLAKGKVAKPSEILSMRPITREDLPRIVQPRDKSASIPQKLRESHHLIARLIAVGHDISTTAVMTGYSYNRVSVLTNSPAMIEQIALYRKDFQGRVDEQYDSFAAIAVQNMIASERQLNDHLAEADEENRLLPIRELREIVKDRADRFGYGKHTTSTNVNVDFASRLEAAIARSGKQNVIEASPSSRTGPQLGPRAPQPPAPSSVLSSPQGPIRRLA